MVHQVRVYLPLDAATAGPALGILVAFGAGFGVFRLSDRTLPIEAVGPLLSQCRLCLVCGYDCQNISPAQDGCTVCPECGAAMLLSALTNTPEHASPTH